MRQLRRETTQKYTPRILQYGDGNFLRAFLDLIVHLMNQKIDFDAGITIIKARPGTGKISLLNKQEGLFTVFLNGIKDGKVLSESNLVASVQEGINPYEEFGRYFAQADNPDLRFIFSNTTEAGIVYVPADKLEDKPQQGFPAKLTALLYRRFQKFNGASDKGLIILPCELINNNGDELKSIVLKHAADWKLETDFLKWLNVDNFFCNTLVDRIVPGYPVEKEVELQAGLGYKDELMVEAEQFHLLVIQGADVV